MVLGQRGASRRDHGQQRRAQHGGLRVRHGQGEQGGDDQAAPHLRQRGGPGSQQRRDCAAAAATAARLHPQGAGGSKKGPAGRLIDGQQAALVQLKSQVWLQGQTSRMASPTPHPEQPAGNTSHRPRGHQGRRLGRPGKRELLQRRCQPASRPLPLRCRNAAGAADDVVAVGAAAAVACLSCCPAFLAAGMAACTGLCRVQQIRLQAGGVVSGRRSVQHAAGTGTSRGNLLPATQPRLA